MKLYLDGIGLTGPGFSDWAVGREVLAGRQGYQPMPCLLNSCLLLPAAERRRMTDTVKLALAVSSEAMEAAGANSLETPAVFASSGGDGKTIAAILECLAAPEREVSPTRFHNSVHNAPSGYWSIATQSSAATTSVCAYDFCFGAGLLEAAAQACVDQTSVLLTAYDLSYPAPLNDLRPIHGIFGVGLVLSPQRSDRSFVGLTLHLSRETHPETQMISPELEALRAGNPAGRSLPLLAAVAAKETCEIVLRHVAGNDLIIRVFPDSESADA